MKMISRAFLAPMLALAGIGCGDDDGGDDDVDMFTRPVDMASEEDMFEEEDDMGPEADMFVPPATVNVRIAHLIPDTANVRVCLGPPGSPAAVDPLPSVDEVEDGVPFRAVGGYRTLPVGDYEARVFAADVIDGVRDGDCSIGSMDSDPDPLLTITVNETDLEADAFYTVAAIGFEDPTDFECPTAVTGTLEDCGEDERARLEIYEDSDVDASNALIRVLHAIPNAPSVDVCFDADGDLTTTEDLTEVFENVAFGTASEYFMSPDALVDPNADDELDPSFRIYAHQGVDADCVADAEIFALEIPTNAQIQAAFGAEGAGLNIVTDEYAVGSVHTIFAGGDFNSTDAADSPAFVPIVDLPAAP